MKNRNTLWLALIFGLSLGLLLLLQFVAPSEWRHEGFGSSDGLGILWQVQTTFLAVGFAGLSIAAQLFSEAPLAIGASRARVFAYVFGTRFVAVGLAANVLIGIETLWLSTGMGTLVGMFWFGATVVLMVVSYHRLTQLYANPSRLDEMVRDSLVRSLTGRRDRTASRYADAWRQMEPLFEVGLSRTASSVGRASFRVLVPRDGLIVRRIKPQPVRRALELISPRANEESSRDSEMRHGEEQYSRPQIVLHVEPGDRTRVGDVAFHVFPSGELDQASSDRVVMWLEQSIEFEPVGSVTSDEETSREIAALKDAVGNSIRAGSFGIAGRALDLLGQVVREAWAVRPDSQQSSRRTALTQRDWIYGSIGDVEQDVLLSPRACSLFVDHAMARTIQAPRAGSMDYFDECLRSFPRIWLQLLQQGDDEFQEFQAHIVTHVQNLAEYAFDSEEARNDLQARCTWTMVELVKLALDARRPSAARLAATYLGGLYEFRPREGDLRAQVQAGQLVLSAWLTYLDDKKDDRNPVDSELMALLTVRGEWPKISAARTTAERDGKRFSRWDWWEMRVSGSPRAQFLEMPHHLDLAELRSLSFSYGVLPSAHDQETASHYQRLLRLLDDGSVEFGGHESTLKRSLADEVAKWETAEAGRLADEPISESKVSELRSALRSTLEASQVLADLIPLVDDVPDGVDDSRPILGMNLRVPRHYLVEKVFNQTYADAKDLGEVIARGFVDGEEKRVVEVLQPLEADHSPATIQAIGDAIDSLDSEAEHFVLVTSYGGLDAPDWYSTEFQEALGSVTHVETAALDGEAILFDRRGTLVACRRPEEQAGRSTVEGTSIALGVFDDVQGQEEPQARVESTEYFVVWPGEHPRVTRFS